MGEIPQTKALRVLGVVVALAILVVGALSIQSALAISGAKHFTVVAPDAEERQIDLGRRGPSLGDLFVFSGPLRNGSGDTVGRIDGQCTTTSAPGPSAEQRQLCIVNTTFENRDGAEIDTQGVGRVEAEDVVLAVTGGTGFYRNVRGEATFDFRRDDRVTVSYELIP